MLSGGALNTSVMDNTLVIMLHASFQGMFDAWSLSSSPVSVKDILR